ncbi:MULTISPECIES: LLM class flavin-dependent oxidoreductase [Streptomycetaceae]|uniref:F420-dependend reductase n=1 Tax=Streptantibioticus cattleyicolor (strain ATCC 35852 / DSM 46488 / JCM 4925 / NBRC 14057 / NRRL 8057) TaxID=1003195 RepID=F8K0A4_STREN|nr:MULTISPECIES: LLM class flavin-dependent oxidoreductase [Streptomycetaceae]AEW96087.1 F420-dependend reductase [Streptantibioticus cattleyicolor NRRL 8057 = DSM 46488]MYS60618.1 LLM class flavin-dependent oxidoreductase [Streptomyces sp. SID5468]CCB76424.1 F420-dependend reductase [Streptantibioticus cattleyicolor NRRL 8057 = DSM 46488]
MKIGLGLPIDDPAALLSWARRADAGPFSTLGLLDRLVYGNPEPLVTLAGLAGATSRIRVQTEVLIAPVHNTAMLAKQTATLDRISGGRFTLGIGVGGREDDCLAAGVDIHRRGRRLDGQMALLRRVWSGEPYGDGVGPIGPRPATPGGPEVLFGGFAPAALERVARFGDGFLGAALPPHLMTGLFRDVEAAWEKHARPGRPRLVAQLNVALGPAGTLAHARHNIRDYYAFTGRAGHMAEGLLTTPERIRETTDAFFAIGADEVMLYCWSSDADQIDRLADAVF